MTFEIQSHEGIQVVRLHGEFEGQGMADLVEHVTGLFAGPGTRIVLDLGAIQFINSSGLGKLVQLVAQGHTQECRLVLASLSPFVSGVLSTTQLNLFFETYDTVDEALTKLRK